MILGRLYQQEALGSFAIPGYAVPGPRTKSVSFPKLKRINLKEFCKALKLAEPVPFFFFLSKSEGKKTIVRVVVTPLVPRVPGGTHVCDTFGSEKKGQWGADFQAGAISREFTPVTSLSNLTQIHRSLVQTKLNKTLCALSTDSDKKKTEVSTFSVIIHHLNSH